MYKYISCLMLFFCKNALAQVITLPITFSGEYNLPFIELNVTGIPTQFSLDTGSQSGLHITKEMMSKIPGLTMTDEKERTIDLAGNVYENAQFIIKTLSLNGMVFNNIQGVELEPWGLNLSFGESDQTENTEHLPTSPVIGLGFFHNHKIIIDYASQTLTIDDNQGITTQQDESEGWYELPFQLSETGVLLSATVQDKHFYLGLDTGAIPSIIKSEIVPKTAIEACSKLYPEALDNDCNVVALKFPSLPISEPVYAVAQNNLPDTFDAAGLVGSNFLEKFIVMIDIAHKKLKVKLITLNSNENHKQVQDQFITTQLKMGLPF